MNDTKQAETVFPALGTTWRIAVNPELRAGGRARVTGSSASVPGFDEAVADSKTWLNTFAKGFSRWDDDSQVSRLYREGGELRIPDYAKEMFALYREIHTVTEGDVSVLTGTSLASLGFDGGYTGDKILLEDFDSDDIHKSVPAPTDDDFLAHLPVLCVQPGELIDIGAAGKGLAVDQVFDIVSSKVQPQESDTVLVDGSGDMRVYGGPVTVGLEDPRDTSMIIGSVELRNQSLAASSSARRRHGRWHHIISAITGEPVNHIQGVWTVSHSCMTADMMSTALFFALPQDLEKIADFGWLVMMEDKLFRSAGFPEVQPPPRLIA